MDIGWPSAWLALFASATNFHIRSAINPCLCVFFMLAIPPLAAAPLFAVCHYLLSVFADFHKIC